MKDVFLSHASADKETHVRPLAVELEAVGISFWLDEAEIAWGESIAWKINEGLRDSRYVVVFISRHFIGRGWPEKELFAALHQQVSSGANRILPIIVGEPKELLKSYPLLSDISFRSWGKGGKILAQDIRDHLRTAEANVRTLVEHRLRHYFRLVSARDLTGAYGCFSDEFRATTSLEAYGEVFARTIHAELLEFRLLSTIEDVAFCHIGVAATGSDGKPEVWRGSVEMTCHEGRWIIRTMKGLKRSPRDTE